MKLDRYKYLGFSIAIGGSLLIGSLLLFLAPYSTAQAGPTTPQSTLSPTPTPHPGPAFVKQGGAGLGCTQSDPCGSVQYAIDYSYSGYGDTIYIAEGTYTGTGGAVITITKNVTLYGGWDGEPTGSVVRDPEQYHTVLDGEGRRRVVYIVGSVTTTLDGLVIARGNATGASVNAGYGGGIYSWSGATPIIANSTISSNVAATSSIGNGGGICIRNPSGTVVITGSRVISNAAALADTGAGGGIYLRDAPNAQVVNNEVLSNVATVSGTYGYGGGIAVGGYEPGAVLSGNRIEGNVALARSNGYGQGYGGGIDVGSPSVLITDNEVVSNTATITGGSGYGGGIALLGTEYITITANRIEHNVAQANRALTAESYGGGIYGLTAYDLLLGDNIIRHNVASANDTGRGGGIALRWYCQRATVTGNLIQENFATIGGAYGYGGGLLAYASPNLQLEGNRILSNTAGTGFRSYGGGLYVHRQTSFTMTNNIVAANLATYQGGGMALEPWATGPITGTLVHNTFAANDRGSGGGRIALYVTDANATLVLTNNLIVSHTVGITVTAGSTATLYNTLFYTHSEADTGGDGLIVNTNPITGQDPLLDADYHLEADSPAIDAGVEVPWLTTDIDGDPRPSDLGPDIGADEFHRWTIYLPLTMKEYP